MPKFFIESKQIKNNKIEIIGEDVKHIIQVLRAKKGEEVTICNIDTQCNYLAKIEQIKPESILCDIINIIESSSEPSIEVSIFQGLPKSDKMEYIIQKNIELGVKEIQPVIMQRCVAKWEKKGENKKIERWQKIAQSAAKQSGRDIIPSIYAPITIQELCNKISEFDLMLVAYEEETSNTLKNELKNAKSFKGMKIGIIIGPEGGIDKKEIEKLVENSVKVITLGKRILRTETASIAIISDIMYEYDM